MKTYVLTYHPVVRLFGPFNTEREANTFGFQWQDTNGDCPCWNLVEHDGSTITPTKP